MNTKKLIHYAIILACPILTYIFPAPLGLPIIGWHLFGVYVGTILDRKSTRLNSSHW